MVPLQYKKRTGMIFIVLFLGSILGILLALIIPVTFIPKRIPYWYLFDILFWIAIGIVVMKYIEEYIYSKKLRKAESGVIEDEMDLEIIKGSSKETGRGILSFNGNALDFRGLKKGAMGLTNEKISFTIELKNILNLRAETINRQVLSSNVEGEGTIIIITKEGYEYRFSNRTNQYSNYKISKWMEYLSNPDILKRKIDLNVVDKCTYCGTLLEGNNTYCPNCLRHRCPVCNEWLEKKDSICPHCESD